jgi:hypothetical protein
MFAPFIELAASKARSTDERHRLAELLVHAVRLDDVEAGFESRINASKAARGEGPTRLSTARRAELEAYADDARALEGRQLLELRSMADASEIIAVLHAGMEPDVAFWKRAHVHTHPADAPVVQELVDAKARLFESMGRFLAIPSQRGG